MSEPLKSKDQNEYDNQNQNPEEENKKGKLSKQFYKYSLYASICLSLIVLIIGIFYILNLKNRINEYVNRRIKDEYLYEDLYKKIKTLEKQNEVLNTEIIDIKENLQKSQSSEKTLTNIVDNKTK